MNKNERAGLGDVVGRVDHRLLINYLADPAEVAPRLPEGMRPHVTSSGGVVVGCCLLSIGSIRSWPAPAAVGPTVRAAAHRISVDVGSLENPEMAVYVPGRHTDSILPVLMGGRVFPGVHQRAAIAIEFSDDVVEWSVKSRNKVEGHPFDIAARASRVNAMPSDSELAEVVIGTVRGLSPGHSEGSIEAADLCLTSNAAQSVELVSLSSNFLDSFSTAEPSETLLMTDVGIVWRRAKNPAVSPKHPQPTRLR